MMKITTFLDVQRAAIDLPVGNRPCDQGMGSGIGEFSSKSMVGMRFIFTIRLACVRERRGS